MSISTRNNDQVNESLQKFFLLSHKRPSVSFDLVYPYTYLFITDLILSVPGNKGRRKAGMLLDYYLRITLKKTDGERRSFPVNFVKYIETMRVANEPESMAFTLNLPVAGENIQTKAINSQEPYYHYAEIALEQTTFSNTRKPIELKLFYQDCDGLEINKL
jgi:hypothetical protein